MLMLPLQIAALDGVLPMLPPVHTTNNPMDLWSHVSRYSSIHCTMPSTVVHIQGLHYSTRRPPQLMPNFPHPSRCCTTTRYIPPYHLGSAILTHQPYRFNSTLRTELSMQSPILTSTPSQLAPFYAGQPITTYDTLRKIWIPATVASCPSKEQLPSMHCKRGHLPPYQMPPPGM